MCSDSCNSTASQLKVISFFYDGLLTNYLVFKTFYKCSIPSCISGPDHLCSDGYCYTGNQCPNGTTKINSVTCTCGNDCSGTCPDTCTSSLQVNFLVFMPLN
jgi:hypothetical protein